MNDTSNGRTSLINPVASTDEESLEFRPSSPSYTPNMISPSGGYEEFFEGAIPCPSCRGTGKIPREKENELVALIPLSDKRLKPSRTLWYVLLAVVMCAIIGGLLAYFLFPHNIQLLSNSPLLQPTYLYVNTTDKIVNMTVINQYNVSNHNYYGVSVHNLSVTVTFDQHIISKSVNNSMVYVKLRSTNLLLITIQLSFSDDAGYLADYCARKVHRAHTILLPFEATLKSTYFGGTFENSLITYQHVRCTKENYF